MAKTKGLEVDRRVGIALSALPSVERHAVERVIRSPRAFAVAAARPGRVQQMPTSGQPLYKMRVSPALLLIYTMVGDTVYVMDVVERATLIHFAARKAGNRATKSQVAKTAPNGKKKAADAVKK